MSVLLRLLLAICLVATAVPAPMAFAADAAAPGAQVEVDAGKPPCHDTGAATPATTSPDGHDCCADGAGCGGCDGGCGCLHGAGLPTMVAPAVATNAPGGPPSGGVRPAAPPRLPLPDRPPIA